MAKSKSRRKGKGKSRPHVPTGRRQEAVQLGQHVEIRTFEISDDGEDSYKPGIADEITEATILLKRGYAREAIAAFQSIIEREPRAQEAYTNLAAAWEMLGNREAAEALSRKAMEKFPKYVLPRTNLAQIHLRRGQVDEAEQLLLPLGQLRKFTSSEFRYYALTWSDILAARSNYQAALSWLKMLSQALPGTPGLRIRRIRYWIGRLLSRRAPQKREE